MKKQKICKHCLKGFTKSPKANRIGITKYCSLLCYTKGKTKKKPHKPYKISGKEYKTLGTKQFKMPTKSPKTLSDGSKVAKQVPDRDANYLKFIRNLPCLVCGGQAAHAHHSEFRGLGEKGSDYSCIPLCSPHHTGRSDSIHAIGIDKFEVRHKLDIDKIVQQLLSQYKRLQGSTK